MKILQIICLFVLMSIGTGCKKETTEPTVEQKEQGTLPEQTTDTLTQPTDTLKSAETP